MAEPDTSQPAEPAPPPRNPYRPPECSIDWSGSKLTPGLLAALARAQARIETVGKEAKAEAGPGSPSFKYATADALVGAMRRAFAAEGLAFVCSWRCFDPPFEKISEKQWVDWLVVLDWAVLFGELENASEHGFTGVLRGTAECIAIGTTGRPPDKSMFAARTMAMGAVALSLAAIDRAATPEDEDSNKRKGDDDARPARSKITTSARDQIAKLYNVIAAARKAAGLPRKTLPEVTSDVMGPEWRSTNAQDDRDLVERLERLIEDLKAEAP